ncbi:DUF2946 domain-containing protein [Pseudoduganella sp. FT25W]|jgi:hypothetical protein|uniref:DUF2946 domain-containing protein n=1 Tax=Duganella alba TaxID=2666081 RepID=A0A6L5Q993_9BURK|nr:DUF2946 domain-containing protein [Duganella alba]MRX06257.1 DUF2946 domain-containing protein [Duganella alba]MRX14651.1 DUF2946 domain-containing protein [Duganella alba]
MLYFVKRQTLHIWIAILGVLFAALAPTVSHALASTTTAALAEMCTVDSGAKKAPTNIMHGMEHCAYCVMHGGAPALPPSALGGFAVIGGHDFYPPLFYTAPQPLHTWRAASPRGPPALS